MLKWLLLFCLIPSFSYSAGTKNDPSVTPTNRDEGDSPIGFSVVCSSNQANPVVAWTLISSSDTIRRSITLYAPNDNPNGSTDSICIIPTNNPPTSSTPCNDSQVGYELTANSSVTIYSKISVYCRSRANNTATGTIKGIVNRDKRDYGFIGSGALQ